MRYTLGTAMGLARVTDFAGEGPPRSARDFSLSFGLPFLERLRPFPPSVMSSPRHLGRDDFGYFRVQMRKELNVNTST